jgi:hypothetical protein
MGPLMFLTAKEKKEKQHRKETKNRKLGQRDFSFC